MLCIICILKLSTSKCSLLLYGFSVPHLQLLKKASAQQISKTASPVEHLRHSLQQVSFQGTNMYFYDCICLSCSSLHIEIVLWDNLFYVVNVEILRVQSIFFQYHSIWLISSWIDWAYARKHRHFIQGAVPISYPCHIGVVLAVFCNNFIRVRASQGLCSSFLFLFN